MAKKEKQEIEYRYYEMPENAFLIALTGSAWVEVAGDDCPHYHNYLEIGFCRVGNGCLIIGGKEYAFSKGYMTVIPSGCVHMTKNQMGNLTKWEYLYLDTEGFFENWSDGASRVREEIVSRIKGCAFCEQETGYGGITGLMTQILAELAVRGPYYREKVRGLVLTMLVEIARKNLEPALKTAMVGPGGGIVSKAVDYISIYYGRPIQAEELAKRCCVSESHFRRVFGEIMHMTPMEYVNLVRIHMACRLLVKTESSVREVGERVGLPAPATFERNFKKILGVPPAVWRKGRENGERRLKDYQVAVQEGYKRDWLWEHTADVGRKGRTYG